MKKAFKILGIIALVAAIGFSLAACKEEEDAPVSNIITITGIPSIYIGKVGGLMLSKPTSANYPVYSIETINETTFSFSMKDWIHDSRPWDGSGSYGVNIFIFDDIEAAREGRYIYAGVKPGDTSINSKNTTLFWSSFEQKAGIFFQFKLAR